MSGLGQSCQKKIKVLKLVVVVVMTILTDGGVCDDIIVTDGGVCDDDSSDGNDGEIYNIIYLSLRRSRLKILNSCSLSFVELVELGDLPCEHSLDAFKELDVVAFSWRPYDAAVLHLANHE